IIKAEKVADATRTIKKAMQGLKAIPSGSFKKYTEADVRDAFRKVSTPNLADAMQKRGVMTGLVPRIKHGAKLVGRAITVKTVDGDWAKPFEAIDRAKPGDGSEIDCGGQKVHAGDWIVGDESGLIVVPQEQAVEMANRATDVLERENRIREEIKRGGTLSSVLELEKWEQIR